METHLTNKIFHAHWKSHVCLRYETENFNRRNDLAHSIYEISFIYFLILFLFLFFNGQIKLY